MKKRVLAIALVTALAGSMLAGCGSKSSGDGAGTEAPAAADGAKVVKIGVYEPASGDNGAGGKQEVLGMQYANHVTPTVEIGGEEYTVQLEIVDNESSNDKGPSAASTLVSAGVSIALGSYGSGVSIAASDVFKEAGIPAMGVTCTNPQVTEGNTHYFRICFLDPFQGTVLANFASENFSAKKAYILTKLGDDYSTGLGYYFKEAFTGLGGEVVEETFQEGNSDFTSYVTSAKNAGADVFFAPVSTEAAALIIEQAAAQGMTIPMMAGDTWDSNVILNAAKGKDVEIYVTTFYQEGGNEEFDSGIKEWINGDSTAKANNGGDDTVAAVTAMGYDAYYVALEALKAAGSTDPAAVNEALWDVSYTGVTGKIEFDDVNGDALRDTAYVKCANTESGAWDFVAEQGVN
ncbi:MAG: ABC transporter substrate-binding protein [Lachnospiraceae bacterium]|jgi:branched-chain amino acid transport system substrate-binding protein|uniref:ABC transporter substrate-binding protein n=1 Tax=Candidatus Merdisoma sp. JLR.KK011 TaxID=3114299 RepID=UPI001434F2B3|nr:ABC transporter substrate-binding protein [Lachnospiraceae bacterium]MCI9477830.1 ABC transporter substrate-binding protein [Lachnospiraceae bacterium]GFI11087.1 Leu/Ile/Val-binding protein [Lachnospiraceae bacterium]